MKVGRVSGPRPPGMIFKNHGRRTKAPPTFPDLQSGIPVWETSELISQESLSPFF